MRISVRQLKQLIKEAIEEHQEGDFRETQSVDKLLAALRDAESQGDAKKAEVIKGLIIQLLPKNLPRGT
jgi:hypothetical protein